MRTLYHQMLQIWQWAPHTNWLDIWQVWKPIVPLVEDLHQHVLCFPAKGSAWEFSTSLVEVSQLRSLDLVKARHENFDYFAVALFCNHPLCRTCTYLSKSLNMKRNIVQIKLETAQVYIVHIQYQPVQVSWLWMEKLYWLVSTAFKFLCDCPLNLLWHCSFAPRPSCPSTCHLQYYK